MTTLRLPPDYKDLPIYCGDEETVDYHVKEYAPCLVVMANYISGLEQDGKQECVIEIDVSQKEGGDDFEMIVSMPESEFLAYVFLDEEPQRRNINIEIYRCIKKGRYNTFEFEYQRNPYEDEMDWIKRLLYKQIEFYC